MKNKRKTALVILVIGIALTALGLYVRHRVNQVKGVTKEASGWIPESSAGRAAGHMVDQKLGQYDGLVRWSLIGGIILIVVGGGLFAVHRKR